MTKPIPSSPSRAGAAREHAAAPARTHQDERCGCSHRLGNHIQNDGRPAAACRVCSCSFFYPPRVTPQQCDAGQYDAIGNRAVCLGCVSTVGKAHEQDCPEVTS